MTQDTMKQTYAEYHSDKNSYNQYLHGGNAGSAEHEQPTDKYELADFAQDNPDRFQELVSYLYPRDQELVLCHAVLKRGPGGMSGLFGRSRQHHSLTTDLHKATHKMAGLIAFGPLPTISTLDAVLSRHGLSNLGKFNLGACIWQYARCRDFAEMSKMLSSRRLRPTIQRAFRILHEAKGREEGLLAGWLLWLVDKSNPKGKGWKSLKKTGRQGKLGPVEFRTKGKKAKPKASGRGGRGQRPDVVKVTRKLPLRTCSWRKHGNDDQAVS